VRGGTRSALAAALACTVVGAAATGSAAEEAGGRLLVISVPGLTWSDTQRLELPAVEGFAADAAVAGLIPRSIFHRSDAGDAYLTVSAGTRAAGVDGPDGEVLRVVEEPTEGNVGEVFERRTGVTVREGSVVLGWPELVNRNERAPYDAELGLLSDTLADAGVDTMVIGNADGSEELGTEVDPVIQRQVGLALADGRGVVERGQLGSDLLTVDPASPFGLRLDEARVLAAFDEVWSAAAGPDRLVALVEASDLVRAQRYGPLVAAERAAELRDEALLRSDALVAALLERVDPRRDTVLLLAPYNQNRQVGLTLTALREPGAPAGYLRTATTQRSGIVSLVDVAPTILDIFSIATPDAMEGRPFDTVASGASLDQRVDHLVAINAGASFRGHLLTPTTMVIVLGLAVLTALTVAALAGGWSPAALARIRLLALALLAVFPLSYLARAFPLEDLGVGAYWAVVVVGSLAAAGGAVLVARRARSRRVALGCILALVVGVLVVDVMTGSDLSLGAAFGYSPSGNSRLYGISNYSYGQVAAAATLLAALVAATRGRGPVTGRQAALGILFFVLVVVGLPMWGSDVGGVLAFTPAVLLFAALAFGYRVRLRWVVAAGLATVGAILAFGFLDLSRPSSERAHLGRLFERIGREGIDPLVSVVQRKLTANLEVSTGSFWVVAIPIGLAFWAFLARHRTARMATLRDRHPYLHAGLMAAATAAVLGSLLNDSGAIVGGIAFTVVAASLAFLAAVPPTPPAPAPDPAGPP
jgi:hypothetical protein